MIYPSVHPSVEFTANGPGVDAVVWPRSSSDQSVKIRFLNPMPSFHTATFTVTSATYTTALGTGTLSISPANVILSFIPYGTDEETFDITGLPNYVAKGDLSITFTLVANEPGGTSLGGGVGAEVFLTESAPTGIQYTVWRDVLEDACAWALGQAGEADCRLWTTNELFESDTFAYDPFGLYYSYPADDVDDELTYDYRLRQLFEDRAESGWVYGDCRDVSNYLCIVFMSLGIPASPVKHFARDGNNLVGFITNLVCGIGSNASDFSDYIEFPFAFHQTSYSASLIYDPACAQWRDLAGSTYQKPPTGWSVTGYWQTPWSGAPPGESDYLGFANRYAWSTNPEGQTVQRISVAVNLRGYTDN